MLAAQEMFRDANKVTKPEKALILGFMAGARGISIYLIWSFSRKIRSTAFLSGKWNSYFIERFRWIFLGRNAFVNSNWIQIGFGSDHFGSNRTQT